MIITNLTVARRHPAYAGHFPGMPVLPGVVLLDAVVHALEESRTDPPQHWRVETAKFQSAARPGEALILEHEPLDNGAIRFAIRTPDRAIANGVLRPLERPGAGPVE